MRSNTEQEQFIQKYYASESSLLKNLRAKAVQNKCDHMVVAPSEACTLRFLIQLTQSKKVVEIGCLYGLTAMRMAEALPETGELWTFEKNPENAVIAQSFFDQSSFKNKIHLVVGDAHEKLPTIEAYGPFDCVFIDADKAGYPKYLDWTYKNLKKGGIVICDNTFLGGSVWEEDTSNSYGNSQVQAMLKVHEELSQSGKWNSHTLPSFDGITVGIKI